MKTSYQNETTFLVGVDDLGLDFRIELDSIDDLYNNLRIAGNKVGISFQDTFTVNNDTKIARFDFTSSHSEDDVEALLDIFDGNC